MSLASALRTEGSSSTMHTVGAGEVICFVFGSDYLNSEPGDWQYQGPAGPHEERSGGAATASTMAQVSAWGVTRDDYGVGLSGSSLWTNSIRDSSEKGFCKYPTAPSFMARSFAEL